MKTTGIDPYRRKFVTMLLTTGTIGVSGLTGFVRTVFGMGAFKQPQGIQEIAGVVKVNGRPASIGLLVQSGDIVTTGPDSMVIFIIDKSVYLVRDNTRLEFSLETSGKFKQTVEDVLRILKGKVLTVTRRRRQQIQTTTAVIGVRGTGYYVEVEPERTYICTCYGTADIAALSSPDQKETVTTTHHESPRYVYSEGAENLIVKAPVINHTDDELIKLEFFVWRIPPFMEDEKDY